MKIFKTVIIIISLNFVRSFGQIDSDISSLTLESLLNTQIKTASKYWQSINEAPASVTIISCKDIQAYGYSNLGELLSFVRSFYLSNDRNYYYLGVRGFSRPTDYNNRILILVNGHSMNENVSGSVPLDNQLGLDISFIERIEIVRGTGSVLYGNNAMFSVINIITKNGKNNNELNVVFETGSNGMYSGSINYGTEYNNGFNFFSSLKYGKTDGADLFYEEYNSDSTNNGIARQLDGEEYYGLYSLFNYKDITFQGYVASRFKEVPTAPFQSVFNEQISTIDSRYFAELKYELEVDYDKSLMFRAYYDNYYYKGKYPYFDNGIYDYLDCNSGNWFGFEGQYSWEVSSFYKFIAGMEFNKSVDATYSYWTDSMSIFDGNYPRSITSLYTQNEFEIGDFIFTLGIRGDKLTSHNFNFSPRLSLIYTPDDLTNIKFLVGKAFRNPTVYESYYYDTYSNFKVNPDLKNEKIISFEILLERKFSNQLYGVFSAYHNIITDLIDTQVDSVDSFAQFVNLKKANSYGLEFELNSTFIQGVKSFCNFTYQISKDNESDVTLTNVPKYLANIGFIWSVNKNILIAPVIKLESSRKTVQDTETKHFVLASVNISYNPIDLLDISLKVNNIFNTGYSYPGGYEHKMPSILQDGRNYILKLFFKF